jgi:FtsZ-interacting cell division protein ZipA
MPGWLKALIAVAVIIVALVIGVLIVAGFWWSRNSDKVVAVVTEAQDFGRNTDNQGCVDESLSRYKKEHGLTSGVSTGIFMRFCLESSRPTPNFCDDVPRQTEFVRTARWRIDQCNKFDLAKDSNCQNLFAPIQQFCEERARKSGDNANAN